jgi:hypothetical protein
MTQNSFLATFIRTLGPPADTWRGIPDPTEDVQGLQMSVAALKETVEQLVRSRGGVGDSALLVKDVEAVMGVALHLLSDAITTGGGTAPTNPGTSTGIVVENVVLSGSGDIIVTFTDGTTSNAGSIGRDFAAEYGNTLAPVPLPKGEWVTITNNGNGESATSLLPADVGPLLNTATGALDFSDLATGDGVIVRPDYRVNPTVDGALLKFRYLLGHGGSAYVMERTLGSLDAGSGSEYIQGVLADYIYLADDNTRLNPVTMQVWLSEVGEMVNNSVTIQVIKR